MPLYFAAGGLEYVVADIGGASTSSWLPIAYTLSAAVPIPFCGYLQDIFGRRPIALASTALLIVGAIVMGTAHSFAQGVVAMALCGAGAGVAELSALAG
jgi:MFS family permease